MTSTTADIRTSEITVNSVRTVVRESGPSGPGEAIVFLHGHPGSSEDWIDLLPVAGRHARAVAIDLPGFGKSDKPHDFDYNMQGYATYLAGVFDELGIQHAHLVLHDFGCFVGLSWAMLHPRRLASIVFINVGIMPGYSWHFAARVWRVPLLGELAMYTITRPAFRLAMRLINPKPLPKAFVDRMYDEFDRDTRRAALRLYRSVDDPGAASKIVGATLGGSERPVLVIWGFHDVFLPYTYAQRQREFFPNAEVRFMHHSGHWPFVDETEWVSHELDRFFGKYLSAG